VSVGSGLAAPGYTLLVDESVSGELFALLASKVRAPAGLARGAAALAWNKWAAKAGGQPISHPACCADPTARIPAPTHATSQPLRPLQGCVLMGEDEWSCARILSGRPAVGAELVEDFNPLEAGLFNAVSVEKVGRARACWIGRAGRAGGG